ncbi:hypothetical protein CCACVL1_22570 [Corchorus capsularis]|uniref:Uncharacterized protein n=1 Tax=Corchorus capsularis TaxID=210143 RepID=A0A1R3GXU8_COCAP|nr:hypothetical protein CCACVL1_22570 [Corchorus capsularis]
MPLSSLQMYEFHHRITTLIHIDPGFVQVWIWPARIFSSEIQTAIVRYTNGRSVNSFIYKQVRSVNSLGIHISQSKSGFGRIGYPSRRSKRKLPDT